jgi:hypothetical protein
MSLNVPYNHFVKLIAEEKVEEFLKNELILPVNGIPIDFYKLIDGTTLLSLIAYSIYPSRLSLSFLSFAVEKGIAVIKIVNRTPYVFLNPSRKPQMFNLPKEKVGSWIEQSQYFYKSVCERSKEEFYQDGLEEFPNSFHELFLKELFLSEFFPYVEGFNYLIVGDDEAKGLFLANLIREGHNINLTIADIDYEIISMYEEIFGKEKFKNKIDLKVIDTRFTRNCVNKQYNVVISYSLTNTSFNTLVDFLRGKVKDYGIAYISNYPALIDNYDAYLGLHKYLYDRGFWITHTTPFFFRAVKIPELIGIGG